MPTGKSNNQSRATELDHLSPGEGSGFDKASAWEKLHGRLHKSKEKRRIPIWWWAAVPIAASVFLFFVLFDKSTPSVDKTEPVSAGNTKNANRSDRADQNTTPATQEAQSADIKKETIEIVQQDQNNKNNITVPDKDLKEAEPIMRDEFPASAEVAIELTPTIIVSADSSGTKPVVPAPIAKKKWKVVHNNELAGAATQTTVIEKNATASHTPNFFPGFRKPAIVSEESYSNDTLQPIKQRRSILPFSSLISQKE